MSTDRREWKQKIRQFHNYKGLEKRKTTEGNYFRPVKHLFFSDKAGK